MAVLNMYQKILCVIHRLIIIILNKIPLKVCVQLIMKKCISNLLMACGSQKGPRNILGSIYIMESNISDVCFRKVFFFSNRWSYQESNNQCSFLLSYNIVKFFLINIIIHRHALKYLYHLYEYKNFIN